jgi:serine/threonine-protein kinase
MGAVGDTDPNLGVEHTLPADPRTLTHPGGVPHAAADVFEIGELLGGTFEIRSQLGAGGMGVVYEALDLGLNRTVAIKIASDRRFTLKHEARALAALNHKSTVQVHGLFVHRDIEYLVMERIRGVSLAEHLRKQRTTGLPAMEALDLLVAIADGLHAIHQAGISHRDIKPANLMLAPGDRVVFMDFGLFAPEFERTARVAGSPEYMAPEAIANEVALGRGNLVDIYAFGVIAYQMLAGEVPFSGNNAAQVMMLQRTQPAPPLALRRPDLPSELCKIVASLLAKDPDDRPQDVEMVLWHLRSVRRQVAGRDSGRHRLPPY